MIRYFALKNSKKDLIEQALGETYQSDLLTPEQDEYSEAFREKHLIESLTVQAKDPMRQVLFYSMLNQGRKRGK